MYCKLTLVNVSECFLYSVGEKTVSEVELYASISEDHGRKPKHMEVVNLNSKMVHITLNTCEVEDK